MAKRFWIKMNKGPWQEVTSDKFTQIENEQRAIFESGIIPSFKSLVTYGEITAERFSDDPEFLEAAGVTP